MRPPTPPGFLLPFAFSNVILRAPSFCFLTRQLHLAPSSAYSLSWFPCVSLTVCQVGAYRAAVLLFAIIRKGVLYGPFIWNFWQDYKALPAVVLKCSHSTSGCTSLHAPPHKWLHPVLKEEPGNCPSIGQCLSALCFSMASVLLLPTPASLSLFSMVFSMLWAWPPFLCLFINPLSLGQVLAHDSLYRPRDSLLSRPLLKSRISPIFPAFSSWVSQQSQNIFFQFQQSITVI